MAQAWRALAIAIDPAAATVADLEPDVLVEFAPGQGAAAGLLSVPLPG